MARKQKLFKTIKRWLKRKRAFRYIGVTALVIATPLIYFMMNSNNLALNTKTLRPLLNLIAEAESNGNYDAYFGNASNHSPQFTNMSISEVQKWQSQFVARGSPSSAVGCYQFLDSTLTGLVTELGMNTDEQFDEKMQDNLAIQLIKRRGAVKYVNNELSSKQFAANLAQEWASLPMTIGKNPSKSYYAHDGLNKSRVSVEMVLNTVDEIQPIK